jgi:4-amino-4-deoxy-L-arabinose transferase-like glycosyltransferase
MEEQGSSRATPSGLPGAGWGDGRWLTLLLLLTAAMRVWQVWHTEVPSRDSVGFIGIAWRLGHGDWREAVRTAHQHPGYPVAVLATSLPVRHFLGDGDPVRAMQLSAQLASALAAVLLVLPMYYLGRELFDRRVAFWATLLFQCLPATGTLMADGLSEPLFLLFASAALLFACRGLRTGSVGSFVLSGAAGGLAYLTRAEGALVPAVTGLVLLGMQAVRGWRRPWGRCARCGAGLSLATLAVALPFMVTVGGLTVKPTARHLTGASTWTSLEAPRRDEARPPAGAARAALPFAVWNIGPTIRPEDRYLWGLYALALELNKGFFHVLWLPALLGLGWFRDRFRLVPGTWVLLLLALALAALLYRLAQWMGYVGVRHTVLLVLIGLYWAVAALGALGPRLASALARAWPRGAQRGWLAPHALTLALLVALAVAPLGKTLATLHADRAGFRQAGAWLRDHAGPEDRIVDPYSWSSYYAGRLFQEPPRVEASVCYVVLEESANKHEHLFLVLPQAERLARAGEAVMRFGVPRRPQAEVVIYKVVRRAG